MTCPAPVLHQPVVLDDGESVGFQFRPPDGTHPASGWLLTLQAFNQAPTSVVTGGLRAVDGLRLQPGPPRSIGEFLLSQTPERVFVPWGSLDVTLFNRAGAGPGNTATVQAKGVLLPLSEAAPGLGRYLYAVDAPQAVAAGAETAYQVPNGATGYRVAWQDVAAGDVVVREREVAGAGLVAASRRENTNREWTALPPAETPGGGGRVLTLQLVAGPASTFRIEWRFDLRSQVAT